MVSDGSIAACPVYAAEAHVVFILLSLVRGVFDVLCQTAVLSDCSVAAVCMMHTYIVTLIRN